MVASINPPVAETEKSLIGILLQNPDAMVYVSAIITAEDFATIEAREAYTVIATRWSAGEIVDLVSVAAEIKRHATYLAEAVDVIPLTGSAREYAAIISKESMSRRVMAGVKKIAPVIESEPWYAVELMADLISDESRNGRKSSTAADAVKRFERHLDIIAETGISGIDIGYRLGADMGIMFRPGDIWTIGGFTSVGKTAVVVDMISRVIAKNSAKIVLISTEMTELQIIGRLVANKTGIPTRVFMGGRAEHSTMEMVRAAAAQIRQSNMAIYDDVYSITDIESTVRTENIKGGVDVVIIDYVQNCTVPGAKSLYAEQSVLATRLQKMAKDNECTVICLSQLSNASARGESKQLELKGAGEWAAVSDVSVILSRMRRDETCLVFQVAKNRHGPTHKHDEGVKLQFVNQFTSLHEIGVTRK